MGKNLIVMLCNSGNIVEIEIFSGKKKKIEENHYRAAIYKTITTCPVRSIEHKHQSKTHPRKSNDSNKKIDNPLSMMVQCNSKLH